MDSRPFILSAASIGIIATALSVGFFMDLTGAAFMSAEVAQLALILPVQMAAAAIAYARKRYLGAQIPIYMVWLASLLPISPNLTLPVFMAAGLTIVMTVALLGITAVPVPTSTFLLSAAIFGRAVENPISGSVVGIVGICLAMAGIVVGMLSDERNRLRSDLNQALTLAQTEATTDGLTGLLNRRAFVEKLELSANNADCVVLMIDLNDFKKINDQHGHHVGDEVLKEVAARLVASVRVDGSVARLGGDEFAVLLSARDQQTLAARIKRAIEGTMTIDSCQVTIRAAVGSCRITAGTDPWLALRMADVDMYNAKTQHNPGLRALRETP